MKFVSGAQEIRLSDILPAELIKKYALQEASSASELRALMALPPGKQEAVLKRLDVIHRYLENSPPTTADADAAAGELEMQRRNFYKLLDKLRRHGPVAGLSPGYKAQRTQLAAKDGLGEVADLAISKVLEANEKARLGKVIAAVEEACRVAKVDIPSTAAVRRRLNVLRAPGKLPHNQGRWIKRRRFGRTIVVDQSALFLPVKYGSEIEYAVATFVLDQETRLVLGLGVARPSDAGAGLSWALEDAEDRQKQTPGGAFETAERLEEILWVLPPGMEGLGSTWLVSLRMVSGTISSKGERRYGSALLPLLGGTFGGYSLMPRHTAAPAVIASAELPPPVEVSIANELLAGAVDDWNYDVARRRLGAEPAVDLLERERQLAEWRSVGYGQRIGTDIRKLFATVEPNEDGSSG